ncbi:MAG: arginine--tRNA ligase [bacterium]|nr:arginine--tRNA ligase [bacterium]
MDASKFKKIRDNAGRLETDIFKSYKKEVEKEIEAAAKKAKKERAQKRSVNLKQNPLEGIKKEILAALKKSFSYPKNIEKIIELEIPPEHIDADLAFSIFPLAKLLKKSPLEIGQKISGEINKDNYQLKFIAKAEEKSGFVNIYLKQGYFYQIALEEIENAQGKYGETDANAKKIAIIDYSSPNVAKPFHVGHLRSTIIGQVLANIYRATGYGVIADNHLGDWGTPFGKLIYAYKNWGNEEKIAGNPIRELKDLYVRFNKEAANNPELKEKAREIFQRLEQKDQSLLALWKRFRDLGIEAIKETYKKLGISFDLWLGESYFTDEDNDIVKDCLKKRLCYKDSQSEAMIVDELNNLPSFLLRKQDGSSLYITRDLETLKLRLKQFKPESILYVVGSEQNLHFQQLFALAKKLGWLKKTETKHISFGTILQDGKKMSTREGHAVELDDLINQSIAKAEEIIAEKNPNLAKEEKAKTAQILGIGAIIYNDLRQARIKNISFDWNRMLNLENGTAAYLQYTYVRIRSILAKNLEANNAPAQNAIFEKDIEFALVKKLAFFPYIIIRAQKEDSPHFICTYLEELAQLFNNFYDAVSVVQTENQELKQARIKLIKSVSQTIKNGLNLLNIQVPDKM